MGGAHCKRLKEGREKTCDNVKYWAGLGDLEQNTGDQLYGLSADCCPILPVIAYFRRTDFRPLTRRPRRMNIKLYGSLSLACQSRTL